MTKYIELPFNVKLLELDLQTIVNICITPTALKDWCLCLQLLRESHCDTITFAAVKSTRRIALSIKSENEFRITKNGLVQLELDGNSIDCVSHFFLEYYRDGAASVDHIDVETADGSYITFSVEESLPPVSPEELKRRVNMD